MLTGLQCPNGWYQASSAQSKCLVCSTGKYQQSVAQTLCHSCGSGRYNVYTARTHSNWCYQCPGGWWMNQAGRSYVVLASSRTPCTVCCWGFTRADADKRDRSFLPKLKVLQRVRKGKVAYAHGTHELQQLLAVSHWLAPSKLGALLLRILPVA